MRSPSVIVATVLSVGLVAGGAMGDTYDRAGLQAHMEHRGADRAASRSEFGVSTLRGAITTVSIRARTGFRAATPSGRPGERIGTLALGSRTGSRSYALRLPDAYGESATLLQSGSLVVRLRPATASTRRPRPFVSVSGVSGHVTSVLVSLRGVLARTSTGCTDRLGVEIYVVRRGAADGRIRSGQRC